VAGDRKYRQPGYQDYAHEKSERGEKRRPPKEKSGGARWQQAQEGGPRSPQMPGTRQVSRCAECGTVLGALAEMAEPFQDCPKCGAALHSCKQCAHFDPASRYECTEAIPKRIVSKGERNDCSHFEIRVKVEKDTTAAGPARPDDARRAFENLFKK
jgi:predicted RNA-binding Zn-ribbon protein involved in translation (DUF1610 family)